MEKNLEQLFFLLALACAAVVAFHAEDVCSWLGLT